jgi:YggT family protein
MSLVLLYTVVRGLVTVALVYASLVALTHWAVRSRRISPFGVWPRFMRRVSDPLLQPVERRVIMSGGNPQNAPLWLLAVVVAGGLVLLSLTGWLIDILVRLAWAAQNGTRFWIQTVVSLVFTILMGAILVRVIASWLGIGPYRRWMRPVIALTDWLIDPIRRILPPFGMFDFSPMVAYLVLYVVRGFVMSML